MPDLFNNYQWSSYQPVTTPFPIDEFVKSAQMLNENYQKGKDQYDSLAIAKAQMANQLPYDTDIVNRAFSPLNNIISQTESGDIPFEKLNPVISNAVTSVSSNPELLAASKNYNQWLQNKDRLDKFYYGSQEGKSILNTKFYEYLKDKNKYVPVSQLKNENGTIVKPPEFDFGVKYVDPMDIVEETLRNYIPDTKTTGNSRLTYANGSDKANGISNYRLTNETVESLGKEAGDLVKNAITTNPDVMASLMLEAQIDKERNPNITKSITDLVNDKIENYRQVAVSRETQKHIKSTSEETGAQDEWNQKLRLSHLEHPDEIVMPIVEVPNMTLDNNPEGIKVQNLLPSVTEPYVSNEQGIYKNIPPLGFLDKNNKPITSKYSIVTWNKKKQDTFFNTVKDNLDPIVVQAWKSGGFTRLTPTTQDYIMSTARNLYSKLGKVEIGNTYVGVDNVDYAGFGKGVKGLTEMYFGSTKLNEAGSTGSYKNTEFYDPETGKVIPGEEFGKLYLSKNRTEEHSERGNIYVNSKSIGDNPIAKITGNEKFANNYQVNVGGKNFYMASVKSYEGSPRLSLALKTTAIANKMYNKLRFNPNQDRTFTTIGNQQIKARYDENTGSYIVSGDEITLFNTVLFNDVKSTTMSFRTAEEAMGTLTDLEIKFQQLVQENKK